jgi:predicted transcriptional regulator of viral defense system
MSTHADRILALADSRGVLRSRDLEPLGIPRSVLGRLVADGRLERIGRGLYRSPHATVGPFHSLVEVSARVPSGVVNLLSALAFHDLTDELPSAVWLAIPRGSQSPTLDTARLELTWTAPRFLSVGVTRHTIEGVEVAITDPARTVADCFKYRSRIGVDVAIAALRDFVSTYRAERDTLWRMAELCRVRTVIRPYLESLS